MALSNIGVDINQPQTYPALEEEMGLVDFLNGISFGIRDNPNLMSEYEKVLTAAGCTRTGTSGEILPFNGRMMTTDDDVMPGDPVRVVSSGWRFNEDGNNLLVHKAVVKMDTGGQQPVSQVPPRRNFNFDESRLNKHLK
jgi:hypothetical protein